MLIIGIAGTTLTDAERDWLRSDAVSGVILFSRNVASRAQVSALIDDIRATREAPLLLCVDQEGGPVQRLREGFTPLPALSRIGALYDRDPHAAVAQAEEHAWVMASEMRAVGFDVSFAPCIDLGRGNRAIGERAFHASPDVVSTLAQAYVRGMHLAGMAATIKHFPGHGSVLEDTHFDHARDARPLATLLAEDLLPFQDAIAVGADAVMMAHVCYPGIDEQPAGYSRTWIQDVLRRDLGFRGAVFSDDIGMAAAESAGGVAARIGAHLDAGCDFVLVCAPALVADALTAVAGRAPAPIALVESLLGRVSPTWEELVDNPQRDAFIARLAALTPDPGKATT
jgi:beta-N-acetylhexosaminidase